MIRSTLSFIFISLIAAQAWADSNLVTCPQWTKSNQKYVSHPKRVAALKASTQVFLPLYRAIASVMGSGRMSEEVNTSLESSGFADLFDTIMSQYYRGGISDEFIDTIKRFHKGFKTETETYVIDISTLEMLSKFRRSYCK